MRKFMIGAVVLWICSLTAAPLSAGSSSSSVWITKGKSVLLLPAQSQSVIDALALQREQTAMKQLKSAVNACAGFSGNFGGLFVAAAHGETALDSSKVSAPPPNKSATPVSITSSKTPSLSQQKMSLSKFNETQLAIEVQSSNAQVAFEHMGQAYPACAASQGTYVQSDLDVYSALQDGWKAMDKSAVYKTKDYSQPLHLAVHEFARAARIVVGRGLRTRIGDLVNVSQCSGDLIAENVMGRYLLAMLAPVPPPSDAAPPIFKEQTELLAAFQRHINCLSPAQSIDLDLAMRVGIAVVEQRLSEQKLNAARAKFHELVFPLGLLLVDANKVFGPTWMYHWIDEHAQPWVFHPKALFPQGQIPLYDRSTGTLAFLPFCLEGQKLSVKNSDQLFSFGEQLSLGGISGGSGKKGSGGPETLFGIPLADASKAMCKAPTADWNSSGASCYPVSALQFVLDPAHIGWGVCGFYDMLMAKGVCPLGLCGNKWAEMQMLLKMGKGVGGNEAIDMAMLKGTKKSNQGCFFPVQSGFLQCISQASGGGTGGGGGNPVAAYEQVGGSNTSSGGGDVETSGGAHVNLSGGCGSKGINPIAEGGGEGGSGGEGGGDGTTGGDEGKDKDKDKDKEKEKEKAKNEKKDGTRNTGGTFVEPPPTTGMIITPTGSGGTGNANQYGSYQKVPGSSTSTPPPAGPGTGGAGGNGGGGGTPPDGKDPGAVGSPPGGRGGATTGSGTSGGSTAGSNSAGPQTGTGAPLPGTGTPAPSPQGQPGLIDQITGWLGTLGAGSTAPADPTDAEMKDFANTIAQISNILEQLDNATFYNQPVDNVDGLLGQLRALFAKLDRHPVVQKSFNEAKKKALELLDNPVVQTVLKQAVNHVRKENGQPPISDQTFQAGIDFGRARLKGAQTRPIASIDPDGTINKEAGAKGYYDPTNHGLYVNAPGVLAWASEVRKMLTQGKDIVTYMRDTLLHETAAHAILDGMHFNEGSWGHEVIQVAVNILNGHGLTMPEHAERMSDLYITPEAVGNYGQGMQGIAPPSSGQGPSGGGGGGGQAHYCDPSFESCGGGCNAVTQQALALSNCVSFATTPVTTTANTGGGNYGTTMPDPQGGDASPYADSCFGSDGGGGDGKQGCQATDCADNEVAVMNDSGKCSCLPKGGSSKKGYQGPNNDCYAVTCPDGSSPTSWFGVCYCGGQNQKGNVLQKATSGVIDQGKMKGAATPAAQQGQKGTPAGQKMLPGNAKGAPGQQGAKSGVPK